MAESLTLKTSIDCYITDTISSRFGTPRLYAGTNAKSYVFWALPMLPTGSQITSAKISMFAGPDVMADLTPPTVTIKPALASWDPNSITWANKPAEGATAATQSAPTFAPSGEWVFDVTAALVAAVNGTAWYGFVVNSNGLQTDYWYGSMSDAPMLMSITYTTPPKIPTELLPGTGQIVNLQKPMLTWNTMVSGTAQRPYSFQVQVANNVGMTTPWDSGEVLGQSSSYDLASTAFPAPAAGVTQYWRVRVRSADMVWSGWSNVTSWTYQPKGVLTITTPATVNDPSPTITWTLTGVTQAAYQVIISWGKFLKYDTGIVSSTVQTIEAPQGIWVFGGDIYVVEVRVWDTNARASIAGMPTYQSTNKQITYQTGATPAPPIVDAVSQSPWPIWDVQWTYVATLPDTFLIYRQHEGESNWRFIAELTPAQALVAGTAFHFYDGYAPTRMQLTWHVFAVKAGVASPDTGTVTKTAKGVSATLTSALSIPLAMSMKVMMVDYDIDAGLSEVSDVVMPISGAPSLVTQAFQRYIGSGSGRIANGTCDLTSVQMRTNFLWLRKNPRVFICWADEAIEAYIYNCHINPIPTADGKTDYAIDFQFVQIAGGLYET